MTFLGGMAYGVAYMLLFTDFQSLRLIGQGDSASVEGKGTLTQLTPWTPAAQKKLTALFHVPCASPW